MRKENESDMVGIDLNRPMAEILKELSKISGLHRVSLSGPLIIARDIAHMKLKSARTADGDYRSISKIIWCTMRVRRKTRKTPAGLRLSQPDHR